MMVAALHLVDYDLHASSVVSELLLFLQSMGELDLHVFHQLTIKAQTKFTGRA